MKKIKKLTEEQKLKIKIACIAGLSFCAGAGALYGASRIAWNITNKKYPERGLGIGWNPGEEQMTVYWGLCGAGDKIKRKYVDSFVLTPDAVISNGQEMINTANECKSMIGQKQFNEVKEG